MGISCRRSAAWYRGRGSAWSYRQWCSPCCMAPRICRCSLDRLGFALLAGLLVWRTGGLEAGIAAHAINNVFAYVYAGLTTSVATIKGLQGISWVDAGFDVGGFALFAVLAYVLSRLMKLRTHVDLGAEATPLGLGRKSAYSKVGPRARAGATSPAAAIVGYRVIGSPTDSGSVSLGSSPSTPARQKPRVHFGTRGLEGFRSLIRMMT